MSLHSQHSYIPLHRAALFVISCSCEAIPGQKRTARPSAMKQQVSIPSRLNWVCRAAHSLPCVPASTWVWHPASTDASIFCRWIASAELAEPMCCLIYPVQSFSCQSLEGYPASAPREASCQRIQKTAQRICSILNGTWRTRLGCKRWKHTVPLFATQVTSASPSNTNGVSCQSSLCKRCGSIHMYSQAPVQCVMVVYGALVSSSNANQSGQSTQAQQTWMQHCVISFQVQLGIRKGTSPSVVAPEARHQWSHISWCSTMEWSA